MTVATSDEVGSSTVGESREGELEAPYAPATRVHANRTKATGRVGIVEPAGRRTHGTHCVKDARTPHALYLSLEWEEDSSRA